MYDFMGYVLTVWASPAEAVIVFAILAGVVFGFYKWAQHEPQKRREPKSPSAWLSHAERS